MKIILGDEYGLLKCVDTEKKLVLSKYGEMGKLNGVVGLDNMFEIDNNIISVTHEQNHYILDWNKQLIKSQIKDKLSEKVTYTSQIVKKTIDFSSVILSKSDNNINILQYNEDMELISDQEIDIKTKKLLSVKNSYVTQEIFVLSKDTTVCIFNLDKQEVSFKTKNLPNDELDLQIPILDVDLCQSKQNHNIFYTATGYGEIRTYDKKVKPRPILNKEIIKNKINKLALSNCENYLTIGDVFGHIYMLDKRKSKIFILI
jgi:hypothetical protein